MMHQDALYTGGNWLSDQFWRVTFARALVPPIHGLFAASARWPLHHHLLWLANEFTDRVNFTKRVFSVCRRVGTLYTVPTVTFTCALCLQV